MQMEEVSGDVLRSESSKEGSERLQMTSRDRSETRIRGGVNRGVSQGQSTEDESMWHIHPDSPNKWKKKQDYGALLRSLLSHLKRTLQDLHGKHF